MRKQQKRRRRKPKKPPPKKLQARRGTPSGLRKQRRHKRKQQRRLMQRTRHELLLLQQKGRRKRSTQRDAVQGNGPPITGTLGRTAAEDAMVGLQHQVACVAHASGRGSTTGARTSRSVDVVQLPAAKWTSRPTDTMLGLTVVRVAELRSQHASGGTRALLGPRCALVA